MRKPVQPPPPPPPSPAATAPPPPRSRRGESVTAGFRQVRKDHATELAEDYVELIFDLIERQGEARLVDVARHMGVSHVTANNTVARLQRAGLVEKRPYRSIFLTDAGASLALESRRRHAIVLEFLCAIGVPEAQARIDVEGIEHHISEVTLEVMSRFIQARNPGR